MLTPESAGNDVDAATLPIVAKDKGLTPQGPTGLLRALADAATPGVTGRALPIVDATAVRSGASLFEYDAAMALDLDGELLSD